MRILLTNDDGYNSEGLHAVADLFKDEHEIAVVAPDVQKSGFSHSLTLRPQQITCKEMRGYDYKVYAVGGTPVDCVKFGISSIFKPDIVISGINYGRNLGSDVLYSGTISAAADAAHIGYRAIALSLDIGDDAPTRDEFVRVARFVKDNFDVLSTIEMPSKTILNVNYPSVPPRGVKVCKLSVLYSFIDIYEHIEGDVYRPHGHRDYADIDKDTDEAYCKDGYITITPVMIDRTDYKLLEKMKKDKFVL